MVAPMANDALFPFVFEKGGSPVLDGPSRKTIRSQAMKNYRRKQREVRLTDDARDGANSIRPRFNSGLSSRTLKVLLPAPLVRRRLSAASVETAEDAERVARRTFFSVSVEVSIRICVIGSSLIVDFIVLRGTRQQWR